MKAKRTVNWKRILGRTIFALLAVILLLTSAANYFYYSPRPADLPCRGCTGEARAVSIGGFNLYVRELGSNTDKTPVIVVHGGPGHSSESFKRGMDFLAQDRRVVYYDQRGSGYSQIKPDPSLYTADQLVEELDAVRREVVRTDKFILIGHSAGGAIAQRYALAQPENVEKLILISSIQINNGVSAKWIWDFVGPAFFILGAGLPPAQPAAVDEWFTELLLPGAVQRLYDKNNTSILENSGYASFATWREVSRSLEGPDQHEALSQLPVPTLVIYGAADNGYTGSVHAADLCGWIPDCTLVGFEKSGHWPFLEQPVQFQVTIGEFLGQSSALKIQ